MPETIPPVVTPVDATKHNEEVARKLADQDSSGHSTVLTKEALTNTTSELDKLAAAVTKEHEAEKDEAIVEPPVKEPPKETPPAVPDANAEAQAKAAADKAAADAARQESLKKADTYFKDTPNLPAGASPKSSEAFSSVKIKAAQEISAREAEIEKLRKENSELAEKAKSVVPPETLKELEEHREWRAKLDVEASPKFKEFDKQVANSQEFIYAQLKRFPAITDDVIAQIKKHGGPEAVNMDKILAAVNDPTTKRLIESKLADIEMAKFNKENAIKETKANIGSYLKEREESGTKAATAHNESTKQHFKEFASKIDWFKVQTAPAGATDEQKKAIEASNKFVTDTQTQLDAALNDDSPEMRAILLAGMAQLLHLQRVHGSKVTELETTKKSLEEANAKLAKYTKASTSRLRESSAPPGARAEMKGKEGDMFTKKAGESLDDIAKQVQEERARAAA